MGHKVAYNACYGGFELSKKAVNWLEENGRDETKSIIKEIRRTWEKKLNDGEVELDNIMPHIESYMDSSIMRQLKRHDKDLVKCVETLGNEASGDYSLLRIETINDNHYYIENYDGMENVITMNDMEVIVTDGDL